jgi:hypothetical protein
MKTFLARLGVVVLASASIGAAAAQGSQRSSKGTRDVAPAVYAPADVPADPDPVTPTPVAPPAAQEAQVAPPQDVAPSGAVGGDVPMDFSAFCSAPGADRAPRSPLWTESCLAGVAPLANAQPQ